MSERDLSAIASWVTQISTTNRLYEHDVSRHTQCFEALVDGTLDVTSSESYLRHLSRFPVHESILTLAVDVVRKHMIAFDVPTSGPILDVCGTGGDGQQTFNISTTAFFVLAGAGFNVVKHGNRGVTSSSGSSDVLQELGVPVSASIETLQSIFNEIGSVFLFAPSFHPILKHVAPIRQSLGIRTIFNVMGPLLNPANPSHQLIGAYNVDVAKAMAQSLHARGVHATVFHHHDGYDEWVPFGHATSFHAVPGNTDILETEDSFDRFGVKKGSKDSIVGGTPAENAALLRQILQNRADEAKIDTVCMNAAAAIQIVHPDIDRLEAVQMAKDSIGTGAAWQVLQTMIEVGHDNS